MIKYPGLVGEPGGGPGIAGTKTPPRLDRFESLLVAAVQTQRNSKVEMTKSEVLVQLDARLPRSSSAITFFASPDASSPRPCANCAGPGALLFPIPTSWVAIWCFAARRVPVHMLAELIANGSTPAELMEGYPRLTAEMIRLAPVYTAAYPLRGRPRHQPWRDQKPSHRARRRVDTIAVS